MIGFGHGLVEQVNQSTPPYTTVLIDKVNQNQKHYFSSTWPDRLVLVFPKNKTHLGSFFPFHTKPKQNNYSSSVITSDWPLVTRVPGYLLYLCTPFRHVSPTEIDSSDPMCCTGNAAVIDTRSREEEKFMKKKKKYNKRALPGPRITVNITVGNLRSPGPIFILWGISTPNTHPVTVHFDYGSSCFPLVTSD